MRYRPIEHVVDEIRQSGASWVELHADNLIADREYVKTLFKALKPLNITLVGEADIRLAEDDELLQLAAESGLKCLLVGLETPSQAALKSVGKGFMSISKIKTYLQKFHDYGSKIFQQFDVEGRILTKDWSKYDGSHAVFQPKHMTPSELEEGTWWFHKKTRSLNKQSWWNW